MFHIEIDSDDDLFLEKTLLGCIMMSYLLSQFVINITTSISNVFRKMLNNDKNNKNFGY